MIVNDPLKDAYMLTRGVESRLQADFPIVYRFVSSRNGIFTLNDKEVEATVYKGDKLYIDFSDKNLRRGKIEQYRDDLYNGMCGELRDARNAFYNTFVLIERPELFIDNNWVMLGLAGAWVTDIDVEEIQPPSGHPIMPFPAS